MAQPSAPTFSGRWRDLRADALASLDEPTKADLRLLDRFVQNLQSADEVHTEATAEPFVEGSTGQITEHPGFKVAARCDGTALSIARQLKLTPFVRDRDTDDDATEETEADDPILRARDDLAERRRTRAA